MVTDRLQIGHGVHRLILTDINMPEVDGMQMSKMIKRLLHKVKSKHDMQDANQILNSTLIEHFQD